MAEDLQTKAAELMKKVLTVGVGTLFLTEESLRNLVSEFKLPKELLSGIFDSANKTRKEFLQNLSHDLMDRIKEKVDFKALVHDVLEKNEIELRINVSFKPKKDGGKPAAPDQG